jgi:hypothetical protein
MAKLTRESLLKIVADEKERLTQSDFLEAVRLLVEILDKRLKHDKSELDMAAAMVATKARDTFEHMEARATARITAIKNGTNGRDGKDGKDGAPGVDGKDADEEKITATIWEQVKANLPTVDGLMQSLPAFGPAIRDALELLIGDERLKIEAIANLREELDELKKKAGQTTVIQGGGSSGPGRTVKSYDLSDSLDGVTKTFALPAFYRIISVHLSSFPNIMRPTTDYTSDANAMTITFITEIDAATCLAKGQSLIIVYSELL